MYHVQLISPIPSQKEEALREAVQITCDPDYTAYEKSPIASFADFIFQISPATGNGILRLYQQLFILPFKI